MYVTSRSRCEQAAQRRLQSHVALWSQEFRPHTRTSRVLACGCRCVGLCMSLDIAVARNPRTGHEQHGTAHQRRLSGRMHWGCARRPGRGTGTSEHTTGTWEPAGAHRHTRGVQYEEQARMSTPVVQGATFSDAADDHPVSTETAGQAPDEARIGT